MAFVAIPDKVILPLIAHSTTTDSNTHPPTVNNYSCQLSQSLCTVPSTYTEDIVRSPQAVWYCSSSVIHCNTCVSLWGRSVCRDLGEQHQLQLPTTDNLSFAVWSRFRSVVRLPVSLIQCLTFAVSRKGLNSGN